jgi:hypothetical protein
MTVEWVFDALIALGMVMFALSLRSVEHILRRQDERLRLNARRIWKLEGCSRGDVAEDVQ